MKLNEVVANSCRVCLKRTPKLRSLYNPLDEGEEPPNEMLRLIAGVELEAADVYETLPKCICKNCELSLSMAYQFRNKVLRTHQILETLRKQLWPTKEAEAQTNKATSADVKLELEDWGSDHSNDEVYINEENLQDNRELKVEVLELSLSDIEEIDMEDEQLEVQLDEDEETNEECKPEYLEEADYYNDMEATSTQTSQATSPELEEKDNSFIYDDDVNVVLDDDNVNEVPSKKQKVAATKSESVENVMQAAKKAKPNNKEKPEKAQTRKSNVNAAHICDICGNIYAKRGRMMEHRRRHDKELRFACELCDKRFHLREKLRKHMFLHTGGKPYKCSFCSRTFFYESVKKAHEAVHNGVKPYVCDECNKAFAYAHALSKHKLIHADIKLYHCEYCSKDFRLQHHMKQHVETKLHQNAVRVAQMSLAEAQSMDDPSLMHTPTSAS
ncbi:PREDICTED: zinc finger protein 32 [Rhagoletis zephyria]|uniref:zinc finger protein 32 n=1 Tax=Rhagoletis zephyria TaxID=28612 RepID=UPI0008119782|nr:PREDICTED: zinc finger protein 32 [Rhagoletis zephyria]